MGIQQCRSAGSLSAALLLVSTTIYATAEAQVSADDAGCLNTVNKFAQKLVDTQFKEIDSCVKLASKESLAAEGPTPSQCIQNDVNGKVLSAFVKLQGKDEDACASTPSFGYVGPNGGNDAVLLAHIHVPVIFGNDLDTAILTRAADPDGAKCQGKLTKSTRKGVAALLKGFNKCKKGGLKDGSIVDQSTLEPCFDPSGKKADKALTKIANTVLDKCADTLDLDTVFPGDCTSASNFAACLARSVTCTSCLMTNAIDSLALDCDLQDNAAADLSCVEPPAGDFIPAGFDCFETATDCGGASIEFGGGSNNPPIPADFFGLGSQPFEGVVELGGAGDPAFPDTIIERLGGMAFDGHFPQTATTDIQIVQLDLVSCQPITIQGGSGPEQWMVQVQAGPGDATGQLDASKTHANGGTFTSQMVVQPVFNFFRVDLGTATINGADLGSFPLVSDTPTPWAKSDPGLTSGVAPCDTSAFFPGMLDDGGRIPCCEEPAYDAGAPFPDGHKHVVKPHGCIGDCMRIPAGDDCWSTECGTTKFTFCENPIPADFFDPGSDPFDGDLGLGGSVSGADTLVERLGDLDLSGLAPTAATVPIQLVELSLQSCAPITVTFGGGSPEDWDVDVDLSGASVPNGALDVTRTHDNGGTFSSEFNVHPIFTFTRQADGQTRVLDAVNDLGIGPFLLESIGSVPWVNDLDPTTGASTCSTDFHPGVDQNHETTDTQCCRPTGHATPGQPGHIHVTGPPNCSACPTGACCTPGALIGTCSETTSGTCGGDYFGDGTTCTDSDGDNIPDAMEVNECNSCFAGDTCRFPTNPNDPDTDGDGIDDDVEIAGGSDPCDPLDP